MDVIIPTRNSEDVLETCLKSLSLQTIPVKIIIVDAMSTDKTREIAIRYSCTVLDEPKSSGMGSKRAIACNHGLKYVNSEIVAFLDSDTEIPPTWAEYMEKILLDLKDMKDIPIAGITSGCTPDLSSNLSIAINSIMKLASNHAQGYKEYTYVNSLPGYNAVYKTSVLREVGGFNEKIGGAEDFELNARIRKNGWFLLGIPNSPVIHHERKTYKLFFKQIKGYGWSSSRCLKVTHTMPKAGYVSLFFICVCACLLLLILKLWVIYLIIGLCIFLTFFVKKKILFFIVLLSMLIGYSYGFIRGVFD